jgi:hypothetical protein
MTSCIVQTICNDCHIFIFKINDKRVDDLSRPDAVNIMRNAPERLDLVVLKNKDVPPYMPQR